MQVGWLRMFCDLVEHQNLTRVAALNGLTQSAISQQLVMLEQGAGVRLVHRRRMFFQPTAAGQIYYQHCREILRLTGELHRQMQSAKVAAGNVIQLAACHSLGLNQLPPLLHQFKRQFPQAEIHLRYDSISRVHEAVHENGADLGLVTNPRRRPGLAVVPFRHEPLVLVCHPQDPLRFAHRLDARSLAGHPLIAWDELDCAACFQKIPKHQRHRFEPRHRFASVELVKRAIARELGVAVLPETLVSAEVAQQTLATVPFAEGRHTMPLAVLRLRRGFI
jgi:DNA-binding transcriptional LysR family regulator